MDNVRKNLHVRFVLIIDQVFCLLRFSYFYASAVDLQSRIFAEALL